MRHTRAHTGNRRSHHALTAASLSLCKDCGAPKMPHLACKGCGKYKGRSVVNTMAKAEKKAKKAKATSTK